MDESAAEQPRPRQKTASRRRWRSRLERAWATASGGAARWRRRVRATLAMVAISIRQAVRYYVSGGGPGGTRRFSARRRTPSIPPVRPNRRGLGSTERARPPTAGAGSDGSANSLPRAAAQHALPSADRPLHVERSSDRMTLSDPQQDDAYLTSTVWVDVEE